MNPKMMIRPSSKRVAALARHVTGTAAGIGPAAVNANPHPAACKAQPGILSRDMGTHQWYIHLRRETEGSPDLGCIKRTLQELRQTCEKTGVSLVIAFGPSLLKAVTKEIPEDFLPYETFKAMDGSEKEAIGTQDELLLWMHSDHQDKLWSAQFQMREKMKGHMRVAREVNTFIYGDSLDLSGFQDGTGNPDLTPGHMDDEVAIVPEGQPGAGGSHLIAQRWIHDLSGFGNLPLLEQESLFGRTKEGSEEILGAPVNSHVKKMQFKDGDEKKDEITRRSTPYVFPAPEEGGDGINGLFFIGFCRVQAPLRERMRTMYGIDGSMRDRMTDFSSPASGSFFFAPSVPVLDRL